MRGQDIKIGEVKSISFYIKQQHPIPKIGDEVNVKLKNCNIKGTVLKFLKISWTEKSMLKLTCSIHILDVNYTRKFKIIE